MRNDDDELTAARICPHCGTSLNLCLEFKLAGHIACCPDCNHTPVDPPSPAISTDDDQSRTLNPSVISRPDQAATTTGAIDVQAIAAIAWRCIRQCKDYEGPPVMCPAHQEEAKALIGSVSVSAQRSEQTGAKSHDLKTWPDYFDELISGRKTFEVRRDDRGYLRGDWLRLREWEPTTQTYTGRELHREVTYILREYHAIDRGYVVMALAQPRAGTVVRQEQAVTPSASAAQKTHSRTVPDPAIEQAKEALIEEIQKLMEGNPICDVTAAIDALIQSSASRLQEVETQANAPTWTPEYLADKERERELCELLRRPQYVGGFDLDEPNGKMVAAADRIERLRRDFETEREMHNAWRKRAEEAELRLQEVEAEREWLELRAHVLGHAYRHDAPTAMRMLIQDVRKLRAGVYERLEDTSPALERVEPSAVASALGAEERCIKPAPAPYSCDQPRGHAGPCGQRRPGRKGVMW